MPTTHRTAQAAIPGFANIRVCHEVEDFYLKAARDTLYASIPNFFNDNMLSPTELLHSVHWVAALQNVEMLERTAIQRAAMRNIHHVANIKMHMAELGKLVREGIRRLHNDTRNKVFPQVTNISDFCVVSDGLVTQLRASYILNGAITERISRAQTWNEKVCLLIGILESSDESHVGWAMLHEAVDTILSELIRTPSMLTDLGGDTEVFGDRILANARLFLCHPNAGKYGRGQALDLLAWHFAAGDLPQTHIILGQKLKADIADLRPLCEGPPYEEMKRFKQLSRLIIQCIGPHLSRRDIQPELDLRSARLAEPEWVHQCMQNYVQPHEKIAKLFFIESCITDARSRYRLADILFRLATADSFRIEFQASQEQLVERMHKLADLNRSAIASGFDADQRQKMAAIFDHVAYEMAKNGHLFEGIDQRYSNIAQKTVTIARLFHAGHITEGKLSHAARKRMMNYTRLPGFLEAYITYRAQRDGKTLDRRQALIDIGLGMKRVGIDPEVALYWVGC